MNRSRRNFLKIGAASAATLLTSPALARQKRVDRTSQEAKNTDEKSIYPDKPLDLGPWKYGKGSHADDTVLMFRGNPSHTFYGTGPVPDQLRMHWKHRMVDFHTELRGKPITWSGTGWTGTAVKLGDYVFVGSVGRFLYAFEARTGKLMWRVRGGRMFKSSPCIYDNKLYVGNVDDRLRCFDAATGKELWKFHTGRDLDSSPCVVDGRLYIAGESGYARCFDPHTGKELWKSFLGGVGKGSLGGSNGAETSPAIADGELYAATYDGDLFCVDIADGKIKWKARTEDDTDASPVISGEFVYAAAEQAAPRLYCFARENGKEIWRYEKNRRGYWSTPAVVGNRVYVGGDDRNMHCVDARTGKGIWTFQTGGAIWSSPAVVDGKVIFGSRDSKLYVVDAETGKEISHNKVAGRIISSPCVVDGHVWVGTATGWFYCFGS